MEVILEGNARERMARLLRDLRPKTPFPGKEKHAQTLAERTMQCATPGVSIAAIDEFEVTWSYSFGKLAVGAIEEVTSGTPFQAGSVSKPVFALAVMKLVEAGTLDLDTDVNHYLKSWRVPANDGWQPRVTLRQLLSHTREQPFMDSLAIRQKGRSRRSRKSCKENRPQTRRPSLLIFFRELSFAIPVGAPRSLSRLLWMPPEGLSPV